MEWLLCNNCNLKIGGSKLPFSLTQCGHIYCSKCVPQAMKQCFICKTVDLKTVLLQEPLMPSIEQYFTPMADSLKNLLNCANFQNSQMRYLLNRFSSIEKKYIMTKNTLFEMEKYASKCKHEMKKMKKKYANLEKDHVEVLKTLTANHMGYRTVPSTNSSHQSLMSCRNMISNNRELSDNSYQTNSVYLTPVSASNTSSQSSSRSNDRLAQSLVYQGPFLVPSITKVLRSGGSKSTPPSAEPPAKMLNRCHLKTSQEGYSSSYK